VCHKIFACVYYGIRLYLSLVQWRFFVSFKYRAKAVAAQTVSVSLDMFKHRAKAMATQAASSLLIFINPDPGTECSGAQEC